MSPEPDPDSAPQEPELPQQPAPPPGEAASAAPEPPAEPPAGLNYTFKFARLDPGSAFDFEDTADK